MNDDQQVPINQPLVQDQSDQPSLIEPKQEQSGKSYLDDMDFHRVSDFFDIGFDERKDLDIAGQLSFLYDWAKEVSGSDDRVARLTALKQLRQDLGLTYRGKDLVKKLYQYTRLDTDRRRIENEMKLYVEKTA